MYTVKLHWIGKRGKNAPTMNLKLKMQNSSLALITLKLHVFKMIFLIKMIVYHLLKLQSKKD